MSTPHYACRLAAAWPLSLCGGKAFHLSRMLELRLPVPAGCVVTNHAFQRFLDDNGIRPAIALHLRKVNPLDPESYARSAREIRDFVMAATIPPSVIEALTGLLVELRTEVKLAVRSSAVGEDSLQAAFAGQLDTVLHVGNSIERVCDALRVCWASYWSARALFYQHSRHVELCGMGVVIQEQVAAAISGVLFTRHPGAAFEAEWADSMLAEYCPGLGDALVSGLVNPGRIVISRRNGAWYSQALPDNRSEVSSSAAINDDIVARLVDAARTLEAELGGPQDIEWTIAGDGRLLFLQSRPITTAREAETREVWSNANINENFPGPVTPLLYSIAALGYYHYFRNLGLALGLSMRRVAAMEYSLRHIVGVHGARLYYNLTNLHAVLRMAPFGEFLTESFSHFTGADRTDRQDQPLTWQGFSAGRFSQACEAAWVVLRTVWQFSLLSRRVAAFERTADAFAACTQPDTLPNRTLSQLLGDLRGFLEIRCQHWQNASLADAAAMLSYGLLKRVLNQEFPGEDESALHNSLLKGLRDVVSGMPAVRLWDLSRKIRDDAELQALFTRARGDEVLRELRTRQNFAPFLAEFKGFLDQWGFRCSGELMLTVPSFQECPEAVVEILRTLADQDGEAPDQRLQRQSTERIHETERLLGQLKNRWIRWYLPWPSWSFLVKRLIRWTQQAIVCRERARLKQSLLYSRCRRIVLAIGERLVAQGFLEQSDDIFFLSVQEIDSLLTGSDMFAGGTRELVIRRRQAHAEMSRRAPPDTFTLTSGPQATFPWADEAPTENHNDPNDQSQGMTLKGIGVCGGRATAPAAVLEDITEFGRLSRGDILVARQTDPGWGPVFLLIQGLVIERGGMLSHGAILAREYGLPTVVGVAHATQRIRPGQIVTVNGDRGLVELSQS